jgi:hypothetical protein
MATDLTVSAVDRQNILNNPFALEELRKVTHIECAVFEGKAVLLKAQVAAFFEISLRTVNAYLARFEEELTQNGYEVVRGKRLNLLKMACSGHSGSEADFTTKTTVLGIFDFRAFLNLGMLITESDRARLLRKAILDVVIDTLNQKTGGGTKYINQRDEDFVIAYFQEENYRKEFADALRDCVDMGNFKYPLYTDKIYLSIFKENAQEYRKVLKLHAKENVRDTFYSEILDLVSSYEYGFAQTLREAYNRKGEPLNTWEVDKIFAEFEQLPNFKPLVERARVKMASRDLAFRDALHLQLKDYVAPLNRDEFERFLGEKSKELAERLEDAKDVMKRLKERE